MAFTVWVCAKLYRVELVLHHVVGDNPCTVAPQQTTLHHGTRYPGGTCNLSTVLKLGPDNCECDFVTIGWQGIRAVIFM